MDGQMAAVNFSVVLADNSICLELITQISLPQCNSLTSHTCLDLESKPCLLGKPLLFFHSFPQVPFSQALFYYQGLAA